MPESVIVDDGGSTRIKWAKARIVGAMDNLMAVQGLGAPRSGSKQQLKKNFAKVRIVCQDRDGAPVNVFCSPFAKVLIESHLNQNVLLERTPNGRLNITIYSDMTEPLVESRQHDKKRRYIVMNSGAIEKVTVDGNEVYNTGVRGATIPAGIHKPIIYTSVVLTKN